MDSQGIVSIFFRGFNDVLSSLGISALEFNLQSEKEVNVSEMVSELEQNAFVLLGRVQGHGELLGLAMSIEDAKALNALFTGTQSEGVDEELLSSLKELGEALLGGALSGFAQQAGKGVVQFEEVGLYTSPDQILDKLGSDLNRRLFCYTVSILGSETFSSEWRILIEDTLKDWFNGKREEKVVSSEGTATQGVVVKSKEPVVEEGKGIVVDIPPMQKSVTEGLANVRNMDVILDIQVEAVAKLGSVQMPLYEILSLGPGSIINIGHLVDEPIEIYVNNKLIAKGDVVIVEEKFGIRITEVVSKKERIESLQ